MSSKYTCARCKGEFETAWSDEEAVSELVEKFPGYKPEDCSIICDDCYKLVTGPDPSSN